MNLLYTPVNKDICIEAASNALGWVADQREEERQKAYELAILVKLFGIPIYTRTPKEVKEHLRYFEDNRGYPLYKDAPWVDKHGSLEYQARTIYRAAKLADDGEQVYLGEDAVELVTKWKDIEKY